MGGHASHGHTSDLAFKKRGHGEETVIWDSVVIGDFESLNFRKVKRPWKVPFFRTNPLMPVQSSLLKSGAGLIP